MIKANNLEDRKTGLGTKTMEEETVAKDPGHHSQLRISDVGGVTSWAIGEGIACKEDNQIISTLAGGSKQKICRDTQDNQ